MFQPLAVLLNVSKREAFTLICLRHLGDAVVWGGLDCSDLVARGELAVGLPDRRSSHRARTYAALNPEDTKAPVVGDLGFFGHSWAEAIHIVVFSFGGHVLSADGATSKVTDPGLAAASPHARVRLHPDVSWYRSAPFLGWRRHHELDP